ncbi:MAG: hypothetical protein DRQ08_09455 [Candidatus Latescibacterota bacterium]|nr:MAG: hypothetical protein DRQ08_09455 [Candidatus Latescibacterota bacterium]
MRSGTSWSSIAAVLLAFSLGDARETVTIVDSAGRRLQVPRPVRRMVVLNTDAAEVICALGGEEAIVGVSEFVAESEFLRKLGDRPSVGRWNSPSYERIVELEPEVVIAYGRHPGAELEEKLEPAGIKVARIDCYKIGTLLQDVEALGRMLGREEEAEELIGFYRKYLKMVKQRLERIRPEDRIRVYVESYTELTSVAEGSGGHEICSEAGGINIAGGEPVPYPKVSPEWVLEQNPQVIVKAVSSSSVPFGYGGGDVEMLEALRRDIMNRPGWEEMDAVRKGRVYLISSEIWAGPRAVVGIAYMAKWFYPEVFEDLDPEAIHREYLERFLGLEYKGAFVWPEWSGKSTPSSSSGR